MFEEWWDCFEGEDSVKDIAEAAWNAALLAAANKCNESDGWDMHSKDYWKLIISCRVDS